MEKRGHELTVLPPPEPIQIEADPIRLEQVLVNLLANASRYTNPGGKIALEAAGEDGAVLIRVRDTGIGMPAEILDRVFQPYVKGHQQLDKSTDGLGLGLALVKDLVERHGGTVTATSRGPGLGSEFVVRLPRTQTQRVNGSVTTAKRLPSGPPTEKARALRVLVVDDEPDAARSLARVLASWGYKPMIAIDGPSALHEATLCKPDIVFLDIGLPGMDGYEVAGRLREAHGAELRLVALSGFEAEEVRDENGDPLLAHHLTKPVSMEELRAILEE